MARYTVKLNSFKRAYEIHEVGHPMLDGLFSIPFATSDIPEVALKLQLFAYHLANKACDLMNEALSEGVE